MRVAFFVFLLGWIQTVSLKAQLVKLVDFSHSTCDEFVGDYTVRLRIVSKVIEADTFKLTIAFPAGCCMQFGGEAEMKNDTLEVRVFRKTEDACLCTCCYQSDFKLVGINNPDVPVRYYSKVLEYSHEKFQTFPPSFKLVKRDTIDYTDRYGLKQGRWMDDEKNYRVYANNKLVGWGKLLAHGTREEVDLRANTVVLFDKKGRVVRRAVYRR